MRDRETRFLDVQASEVRMSEGKDGRPVVQGIALRYGSLSSPMKDSKGRPFREKFRSGAFSRALATGADVRLLVNHNRDLILARNKSGTLRIVDGPEALLFEFDPPDSAIADHYVKALARGDIDGVSFRFYKIADQWSGAGEATVREVTEADIDDISVVTYPAYPDTLALVTEPAVTRSLDDHVAAAARRDSWIDSAYARLRLAEAD